MFSSLGWNTFTTLHRYQRYYIWISDLSLGRGSLGKSIKGHCIRAQRLNLLFSTEMLCFIRTTMEFWTILYILVLGAFQSSLHWTLLILGRHLIAFLKVQSCCFAVWDNWPSVLRQSLVVIVKTTFYQSAHLFVKAVFMKTWKKLFTCVIVPYNQNRKSGKNNNNKKKHKH